MGNREAWAKCKPREIECPSVGDPDASIVRFVLNSLSLCVFLFLLIDNASAVQKKIVAPSKEKRPCEVVGNEPSLRAA